MANYFILTLDTTGPSNAGIKIEGNSAYTTKQLVYCMISTGDGSTSGYQMKIWGDVDTAHETNIQDTESASSWITFSSNKQIKLASGDGSKTVQVKLRDDVYNESAQASDSINLDTTRPAVTVTAPDVSTVSKINGKDEASFSFSVDTDYEEYKVKVVSGSGSSHETGTEIGTANGSSNMSGTGSFTEGTATDCLINGADLEAASSSDGEKTVKVFVRDSAGNWSV